MLNKCFAWMLEDVPHVPGGKDLRGILPQRPNDDAKTISMPRLTTFPGRDRPVLLPADDRIAGDPGVAIGVDRGGCKRIGLHRMARSS